jgi:hypothetical protein
MPGLVPGIHVLKQHGEDVDGRKKPDRSRRIVSFETL